MSIRERPDSGQPTLAFLLLRTSAVEDRAMDFI
jgi:hypothetical protein